MSSKPINVVIPMGGLGSRFEKDGYRMPKPLINIMGRPMISWLLGNLKLQADDVVYIALQEDVEKSFKVSEVLLDEFPNINFHFTFLDGLTRGAAETFHIMTSQMNAEYVQRPTISLDCDTLYFSDVLASFRGLSEGQGCCCYFDDKGNAPIFSYISFDSKNRIHDIAEKVAISHHANTGAYGFGSASVLNKYLESVLEKPVPAAGEFYTSAVINTMIKDGHEFQAILMEDFECVGTPKQLVDFIKVLGKRLHLIERRVVVMDLDSVPQLAGVSKVSDVELKKAVPEDMLAVIKGAIAANVDVRFSLDSGFMPKEGESEFVFAELSMRSQLQRYGQLLPLTTDVRKVLGY